MFQVFFTNFSYFSQETFTSFDEALTYGKSKCFEFSIHHNREVLASWSPLYGLRDYR